MPFPLPRFCNAWLNRLRRNDWRALLLAFVGLSIALVALAWGITWQRLAAERMLVARNATTQQETVAAIIAENLAQVLDRGPLMAIAASEWFAGEHDAATRRLSAMRAGDRAFLRIALYDLRNRRVYSSSPAVDQAPLLAALRQATRDAANDWHEGLRIAPTPASAEQAWQVPLLFPVLGRDRRAQGVLLLVLDLGYFLGLYQHIDIGPSGLIRILSSEGRDIAEIGRAGLVLETAGTPESAAHPTVLGTFRPVPRHPFVVAVSRDRDEILAGHRSNGKRFLGALAALTAVIAVAAYWVARSIRRQGRLFSALAEADDEKRGLIEQLEGEKRRAFRLAAHDHLTELPNRRMFHELVISHLSRAKRSRKHYALLYLDLDRFKYVNDTLGHHVGDLLLQAVAGRLRSTLRESDLVARLGGDEFAILLTDLEKAADAATIATKLVDQIARPFGNLDGNDILVSTSIGIALYPRDGYDFDTLCRHADTAMYQSKHNGRGKYTFYDPELNPASNRLFNLEQRLPRAIADNELVLHFQPKVRLSDYRIVGFEALVRWQHPDYGLIHPNDFIPLAEHAGFIVDLGDWVAEACCRELAAWQAAGLAAVPIACNVSARQLQDASLPERFAAFLAKHGVAPRLLEIEITESSLVESFELAGQVLRDLEALGMSIALDDFGNGFSNFAHIRTLPIHCLKIDRQFIGSIRNSPDDAVIVSSIIALAHNLRMRVIAEGVELLDQLVHLKTAGCDEGQGYFISRPLTGDNARQLLANPILAPT